MLRAVVGLAGALALVPAATTLGAWTDTSTVKGARSTATTVTARPLQCVGGPALSKDVTWAPFTDHPSEGVGFYTVRVDGIKVTPVWTGTTYSATVNLGLGTLLGSVPVSVTVWSGSAWAKTSTITLGRSFLGTTLGFACP